MNSDAERYAQLFEVLTRARGLSGAQRDAYLADACGSDDALRAQVMKLLAAGTDDGADDAFADKNVEQVRQELEGLVDRTESPWLPEKIGEYTVIRQLGQGGMGVVYEALQESPRRRVAIKLLHPMHATVDRLRRFRHEAEVLGSLQHSGIAPIFEAGTYDIGRGPQPFFAMELVQGVDIRTHCDRENLDRAQRIELLARVADAVQYAHDRGVIHRDLKPDNVLIDEHGCPRILDFGIARASSHSAALSTIVTEEGQLVGTLAYMAPEQLSGSVESISPQVDVYALGVLGFELLVGRIPREIEDLSISQAIMLLAGSDPPRASTFDVSLRGDVETILGKALESECPRRYATAGALAADLRRHLGNEPIQARPPTRIYLALKFTRRHRALVGGTVATLFTLIVGVIVSLMFAGRANEQRDQALKSKNEAVNGLLQSTQILLDAGRGRDAAAQLALVPGASRGVAWRLLDRAVPVVLDAPVGVWRFTDDEHLVGVGDDRVLLYSLVENGVVRELFRGMGFVGVDGAAPCGMAVAHTADEVLLLDLLGEEILERSPHRSVFRADGGGQYRHPEVSDDGLTVLWYSSGTSAELRVAGKVVREIRALSFGEAAHLGPDGRFLVENRSDGVTVSDVASGATRLRHPIEPGDEVSGYPVRGGVLLHSGPDHESQDANVRRVWRRIAIPDDATKDDGLEEDSLDGGKPELQVTDLFSSGFVAPSSMESHYSFSYTKDGRFVAVQRDAGAFLGDTESGMALEFKPLTTDPSGRRGHLAFEGKVAASVEFCPSGRRFATTSGYEQTMIFELDSRENDASFDQRVVTLRGHAAQQYGGEGTDGGIRSGWIFHLAVSNDGSLIASAAPLDQWIRVWDARTGACIARLKREVFAPENWQALMAFSPDDHRLVVTTPHNGRAVSLVDWNLLTGDIAVPARLPLREVRHVELLDAFIETLAPVGRVRLSQHAQMMGSCALVGALPQSSNLPRPVEGKRWRYVPGVEEGFMIMSVHPSSARVAVLRNKTAIREGQLKVLDATSGEVRVERDIAFSPCCCAYSPDGSVIAIGTKDGRVLLYETEFHTQQLEWRAHTGDPFEYVQSIAWTPDGTRLVTASGDATVKVWDTRTRAASLLEEDQWASLRGKMESRDDLLESLGGMNGMEREAARVELIRRAHPR